MENGWVSKMRLLGELNVRAAPGHSSSRLLKERVRTLNEDLLCIGRKTKLHLISVSHLGGIREAWIWRHGRGNLSKMV